MMKIINSYRAHRNWIKAHGLMATQAQGLALVAIRKAVDLEPNLAKVPTYLELQGHIESSIGKVESALASFRRAIKIIEDNPTLFTTDEAKDLEKRIVQEIKNRNNKSKT